MMDPATGRLWRTGDRFLRDLYVHEMNVLIEAVREWLEGKDFARPLDRRLRSVGCAESTRTRLVAEARAKGWQGLAALDAAVRMAASLARGGAIREGRELEGVIRGLAEDTEAIPASYFTVRAVDEESARIRGAVLVRAKGMRKEAREEREPLPAELARALAEPPARPLRQLVRLLREGGLLAPSALLVALAFAAAGAIVEAILLRSSLELPRHLGVLQQRLGAAAALVVFVLGARALMGPVGAGTLRIGRQVEVRLRRAFLEKLPRLGDRYFQSRPISDMAERAHSVNVVRSLPELGAQFVRAAMELVVTAAAIVWFDPASGPIALAACAAALVAPLAWQPALHERDMRVRTHGGAIARVCLDSLLGLMPIRTHGAEVAVRREHESLVVEWARASRALVRASAWAEAVPSLIGSAAVAWMGIAYVARAPDTSGVLLLVYWAINMPLLGQEIALVLRQYPGQRNVTLRQLEPLGALEEPIAEESDERLPPTGQGVAIDMNGVSVVAAGHLILRGLDLRITEGEEIGVVGPSGAGKSSLAGLLLGWHRASAGEVLVDGEPLLGARLDELRRRTAWVDPAIQIWNRSLYQNLHYGADRDAPPPLARVLESADIQPLLDRLPDGMQTALGEGGALVAGGEGQRVRLGRAMMRPRARLVVFDEPFRGLDRERRRVLLQRARRWWQGATLLCITHDVAETLEFPRVLVIEGGAIVEDGDPRALATDPASRYGAMLRAERAVLETMWGGSTWRRLRLQGGQLTERSERGEEPEEESAGPSSPPRRGPPGRSSPRSWRSPTPPACR
jgi:ATP-binding cassette subfamily B protein